MKKSYLFVLALMLFMFSFSAMAQEEQQPTITISEEEANFEIIADTNINNAVIADFPEEGERQYVVEFEISNDFDKVQPDIKYSLELYKMSEDQGDILFDQVVYDEILSLNPGEMVTRRVNYDFPVSLEGEYQLRVSAFSEKGLPFSVQIIDTVEAIDATGVLIDVASCYLQIDGEKFNILQGIDLSSDEILELKCEKIQNLLDKSIEISPRLVTRERIAFGKVIKEDKLDKQTLAPKSSKSDSFVVPTANKPQAYQTELFFEDSSGKKVSNSVNLRYVIQGESATIQGISVDKNSYKAGDVANVLITVAGMANVFEGSRSNDPMKGAVDGEDFYVTFSILDKDGMNCSDEQKKKINGISGDNVKAQVKITKDCSNPVVSMKANSEKGDLLDESEVVVAGKELTEEDDEVEGVKSSVNLGMIAMIFIIVAAVIGIIFYVIKFASKSGRGFNSFVALLVFGGALFFFGHNDTQAATFTVNGACGPGYCIKMIGTYNLSKSQIVANCEPISAQMQMQVQGCNNMNISMKGWVNGQQLISYFRSSVSHKNADWITYDSGLKVKNLGVFPAGNHPVNFTFSFHRVGSGSHDNYVSLDTTKYLSFRAVPAGGITANISDVSCATGNPDAVSWTSSGANRCYLDGKMVGTSGSTNIALDGTLKTLTCQKVVSGKVCGQAVASTKQTCGGLVECNSASTRENYEWNVTGPETPLCTEGTPNPTTVVFPVGEYGEESKVSWSCEDGESTVNCEAKRQTTCGSVDQKTFTNQYVTPSEWTSATATSGYFCKEGAILTPSSPLPQFPALGQTVTWSCNDAQGNGNECSATNEGENPVVCPPWDDTVMTKGELEELAQAGSESLCGPNGKLKEGSEFYMDDEYWKWDCVIDMDPMPEGVDPNEVFAQCKAKNCLANTTINEELLVYFKEDGTVDPAKVFIESECPELCCTYTNTSSEAVVEVCKGESGEIKIDGHPDKILKECTIGDDDDDDDDDDDCEELCASGSCPDYCDKEFTIQCVCTANRCSGGSCVATPVFASTIADANCSSECSSNADCGGGGSVIETN